MKICPKCRKELLLEEFFSHTKRVTFKYCSKCRTMSRKWNDNWRAKNPEYRRWAKVFKYYRISKEQYETLLSQQDYRCAVCYKPATQNLVGSSLKPLYVDHSHQTQKVRGLLCFACNSGLGVFKENTNILRSAIKYLESHAPSKNQ